MKFSEFWLQMFTGEHRISSKRVMGCLGFLCGIFICVWCTIKEVEAPQLVDVLFITAGSLLGVDSIASAFKKPHRKEKDTYYIEENK